MRNTRNKLVIFVSADGLAPIGARPFADTMMTTIGERNQHSMMFCNVLTLYDDLAVCLGVEMKSSQVDLVLKVVLLVICRNEL